MFRRGFAFCLSLAMASAAFGGAEIQLIPDNPGPYNGGETVLVDVLLVQDGGGSDHELRMVQLDVTDTDSLLGVNNANPMTWDFSSTQHCIDFPPECGADHYIDATRFGTLPPGPHIFVIAFGSENELGENADKQLTLKGDGTPLKVAQLEVILPPVDGTYVLDVVNDDELDNTDLGAQVHWGFGTNIGPSFEPITAWRASGADPDLTGGTLEFCVGPVPPCPPVNVCPDIASVNPPCDSLLPRIQNNIVRINFDDLIADPLPGEIEVRVLEDGGVLGADVTADWTCEVEGGTTLKCTNTGTPAANETWYGIIGTGPCPYDFELHYGVVYGDANGDTRTNAFDVNDIWVNRTDSAPDDSPYDVNGDGRINAFDVNDAWVNRNSEDPGKPSGHVCP